MKADPAFSYESCTYEVAFKLLLLPSGLQHLRTLDWCHAISKVLQNIQFTQSVKLKKRVTVSSFC